MFFSEGYFPEKTLKRCRRNVRRILKMLPNETIRDLISDLKSGKINGSIAGHDFIAAIARSLYLEREQVFILLNLESKNRADPDGYEYWFMQIGGVETLGKVGVNGKCLFTETTINWCLSLLKHRRNGQKKEISMVK